MLPPVLQLCSCNYYCKYLLQAYLPQLIEAVVAEEDDYDLNDVTPSEARCQYYKTLTFVNNNIALLLSYALGPHYLS